MASGTNGERRVRLKPDARKNLILREAARLFYTRGYHDTSLQDIADAAGLQKGSLYHYITGKEQLLFELLEAVHQFLLSALDDIERQPLSPLGKLQRLLETHARYNAEEVEATGVFYNDFGALNAEHHAAIVAVRDRYENYLRQLVQQGQAAGEIDSGLDPRLTVMALLGMLNWIHRWYRLDGPVSPDRLAASFAELGSVALLPRRGGGSAGGRPRADP